MLKIHLDTDLGGDIDDACALAMLLNWPNVEITGITTVAEENGRRAGYTKYILRLAGRENIPVMDYNIQVDVTSAHHIIGRSSPMLVPLTVTIETAFMSIRLDYIFNFTQDDDVFIKRNK